MGSYFVDVIQRAIPHGDQSLTNSLNAYLCPQGLLQYIGTEYLQNYQEQNDKSHKSPRLKGPGFDYKRYYNREDKVWKEYHVRAFMVILYDDNERFIYFKFISA